MRANEKVMITEITSAIEETLRPAAKQPKKVISAIEKSAKKLAHKLVRTMKKEAKSLKKAGHKKPVRAGNSKQRIVALVPQPV